MGKLILICTHLLLPLDNKFHTKLAVDLLAKLYSLSDQDSSFNLQSSAQMLFTKQVQ